MLLCQLKFPENYTYYYYYYYYYLVLVNYDVTVSGLIKWYCVGEL